MIDRSGSAHGPVDRPDDAAASAPPDVGGRQSADAPSERRLAMQVRFGVVTVAAIVLLAVTYLALVTTEPGQQTENLALRGVELRSTEDREAARERLSQITVVSFALATTAVFVTGLVGGRGGLGVLVAGTMVVSVVLAELLKEILPRPDLAPGPAWLLRNSFPSGSAAVATSLAVGSFLVAPARLRWLVLPLGALYAAVIGEAIQSSGWHRLSDTIGGCLVVIALASAALALLARAGLVHRSDTGRVNPRIGNALVIGAAAALLVGAVLIVLPAIFPLLATPEGSRRAFLQSAFPLIGAGLTVLGITLFARLVEPYALGRTDAGGGGSMAQRARAPGGDQASTTTAADAE